MDEFTYEESACPKCGHSPTKSRHCDVIGCSDGYIDEYDEDPVNFSPGESYETCQECHGTGVVRWCPECGCDIARFRKANTEEE